MPTVSCLLIRRSLRNGGASPPKLPGEGGRGFAMVRRLIAVAFFAVFAVAVNPVSAGREASSSVQSVDEIVARNIEAKGGLTKLRSLQSMKQTAKITMQGMEATMTVFLKRPHKLRQEMQVGGQTVVNGFDGVTPWILNPLVPGSTRPMIVSGPQADMLRDQGDFDGPLVDYKAKGFTLDLVGVEALGDRKVHHLRMVSSNRQTVHLYLDASTSLEVKRVTEVEALKLEQEFSDYRVVDGMRVPFVIRMLTNGVPQTEFRVQSVEFNVPMDDAIFRMPKG
jgi:outer membrane lipoprotein-sorting protein